MKYFRATDNSGEHAAIYLRMKAASSSETRTISNETQCQNTDGPNYKVFRQEITDAMRYPGYDNS